ncbi:MAG: PHP domain-containing protein, partial [Candidatus Eisenbacteria bacterium]
HRRRREDASFMKADLHVHSSFSHDVPSIPEFSPRALYDRAVERGMDFFTLTDHDTMEGIEELQRSLQASFGDHPPIPCLRGVELKVYDRRIGHTIHINILGLASGQLEELKRRRYSLARFIGYCRQERLFHVYNHPLWFERGERARLETVERVMQMFPVVELNAGRIPELNARTAAMARRHRKPLIAASDTHVGQVGKAYTQVAAATPEEFLAGVLAGEAQYVPSHFGFHTFFREVSEAVDLWLHDMSASMQKRALPSGHSDRYWLAHRILGRRFLRRPLPRRTLGILLKLVARATTYAFIRQQRRMALRLSDA